MIDEGGKVEKAVVEELLSSVGSEYGSDDAASTAARDYLWEAVCFNQSLNYSDVVHAHDGSSTQQKRTPTHCMPHLPEELKFFVLGQVGLDDGLEAEGEFAVVLFDEEFGAVIGVAVEEGRVDIGNVAVTMRADDFDEFERVLFHPSVAHALD